MKIQTIDKNKMKIISNHYTTQPSVVVPLSKACLIFLFVFNINNILQGQERGNKSGSDTAAIGLEAAPILLSGGYYSGNFSPPDFQITPPNPNSAQLGMFGPAEVGLFTGVAQYSIPLYTFETPNISLPITLNYSSDGLKVDELSSWVGTDWTLSAGGLITRYKRGLTDCPGSRPVFPDWYSMTSQQKLNFCSSAASGSNDVEPDIFVYSFLGYSGKFAFNDQGAPVTIPFRKIDIQTNTALSYNFFNIRTPDGVIYKFRSVETTYDYTKYVAFNSSWYLTTIIHPTGDSVTFTYDQISVRQYLSTVQNVSLVVQISGDPGPYPVLPSPDNTEKALFSDNSVLFLKEIIFHKYGKVIFEKSADRPDAVSEHRLNKIVIKDVNGNQIKAFRFWYQFPLRSGLFPCKVPAGSFSSPHVNHHNYRMFLDSLQLLDKNNVRVASFRFSYNSPNELPARFSYAQDHWGYFNGKYNNDFVPLYAAPTFCRNLFSAIVTTNASRKANYSYSRKGMLNRITFPVGGYTTFEYESNKNSAGLEIGGCRVLRIKTYKSATDVAPSVKKYLYTSTVTSIDTIYFKSCSYYWNYLANQTAYSGSCAIGVLSSNSLYDLSFDDKYHVIYPSVEVREGENRENGYTVHVFDYSWDAVGTPINGQQIVPLVKSNSGFESGIKTVTQMYDNTNSLKMEENTSYKKDETRNIWKIRCMAVRKRPAPEGIGAGSDFYLGFYDVVPYDINSVWYYVRSISRTDYYSNGTSIQTKNFTYDNPVHAQLSQEQYTNSQGQVIQTKYYFPQDYNNIENFSTLKQKFIIGKPVDVRTYNGSQLITGQQYKYNNFGQITDIYKAELYSGSSQPFSMTQAYTFNHKVNYQYISNNCLNIETPKDNVSTYYLWDSSGKYLMAKITGGNNIWSSISTYNGKPFNYSSKTLMASLKSAVSGSIIYTYSFSMLTGNTEMTEPTGITTFFTYDDYGRLSIIRNDESKLLKSYEYNYLK